MAQETQAGCLPLRDEKGEMKAFAFSKAQVKQHHRVWFITLTSLLILLLISGGLLCWLLNRKPLVQYTQAMVTVGNIKTTVSATGPITSQAVYQLNFLVAGQISEINVQIGQHIKQGQQLAKITTNKTKLQDTIKQNQITVTGSQNALDAAQAALSNAQALLDSTQKQNEIALKVAADQKQYDLNSCRSGPISAHEAASKHSPITEPQCGQLAKDKYIQAKAQITSNTLLAQNGVISATTQLKIAQNNVEKAKAQLEAAQHALDQTNVQSVLLSPSEGIVAVINGTIGQSVGLNAMAGEDTNGIPTTNQSAAFITIINANKNSISAQVNEADIGSIQVGQTATFTVASYPTQAFHATVSNIGIIGQMISNVVSYPVQLTIDSTSSNAAHLYPGMTATVNITTAQRDNVLLIPTAALTFTSTAIRSGAVDRNAVDTLIRNAPNQAIQDSGQNSDNRVVLTLSNGKLVPVLITIGLSNGQYSEVISGLNEHDQVVINQVENSESRSGGSRGWEGIRI